MSRSKQHERQSGVVCLDFRPYWDALRRAALGAQKAFQAFADAFNPILRARRLAGGAGDPRSTDWQCGPCTGWLHGSCAGPATDCRCTCQGGHLR